MALLGASIDPSLFRQDYSGFVNAANTNANAMAGLGQTIAGGIERYGEEKQNRKKLDASIKASVTGIESAIKMGKSLGIDIESSLSPYLQKINDPNISPIEAAAYAKEASNSISNVLNFGMEGRKFDTEQNRLDQQATLQRNQLIADQKAAMRAESRKAPTTQKFGVQGGEQDMVWNADTQSWEKPRISGGLVDIVKSFEGFNPNAYSDYKQTSVGYGTRGKEGEVLTESQATERLNTELSVHAKRIKDAAELKGVSLNENQFNALASFDFNTGQGASLIERFGDKPNELVAKMQEYTKAGGEDLPGLVNRRRMESALFLTPVESSVGFTPTKTQGKFTRATPEQAAQYNASAGQFDEEGKFYPFNPPTGTSFKTNPDGSVEYITGAGVSQKTENAAKAGEQLKNESFRLNQANTEEAFIRLDTAGTNNPVFAAGNALLAEALPASETGELAGFYERINGENSFIKMKQQRDSSVTGGASGTMTEKEWPRYEGRFSPLKINARKDTIAKSLSLNLLNSFEAINGMPDDVIKAFDEKKITQTEYDKYVSDYITNRQIARVNANGVEGKSYEWTKLNKNLLSKSTIYEAPATSSDGVGLDQGARDVLQEFKNQ